MLCNKLLQTEFERENSDRGGSYNYVGSDEVTLIFIDRELEFFFLGCFWLYMMFNAAALLKTLYLFLDRLGKGRLYSTLFWKLLGQEEVR
jgi:hypothetical protein